MVKDKVEEKIGSYSVVQVATETAEQVYKDGEPVSERQLLVDIYEKLLELERALK